jgi:glucose/arabinose dehydrogenase
MLNIGKRKINNVVIPALFLLFFLVACSLPFQSINAPTDLPPTSAVTQRSTPTPALPIAATESLQSPTVAVIETVTAPALAESSTQTAPTAELVRVFPDPAQYGWEVVAQGLERPVGLFNSGDNSKRLFILEQGGRIRLFQSGQLRGAPFLDITDRVGATANERGLLGMAFHPGYPQPGYIYVNYTDLDGNTVISRFSVFAEDPTRADPQSENILLQVQQPYPNHNGGAVVFGPDGFLYLGLGDGGAANDPRGFGQSTQTLLGKILRIDVDEGKRYAIPPTNPFVAGGGLPEIWAYGLRNPWRLAFDSLTGNLYIADVGQNAWEEIDFWPAGAPGGANFGWDYWEGTHQFEGTPPDGLVLVEPVAEYSHSEGCSVTGGEVYRGGAMPEFNGIYLFGDYCSGLVFGLLQDESGAWQTQRLFETGANISSFGVDEQGEVYLVDLSGAVLRLTRNP